MTQGPIVIGFIDLLGFLLALVGAFMALRLVLRTEKELDTAAKLLFVNAIVLILANLASINDYFGGIIPNDINRVVFHASRIVALVCFIGAMHYLIKITEK